VLTHSAQTQTNTNGPHIRLSNPNPKPINGKDKPHCLALVRRIHVTLEGRLVAIVREGGHHVVDVSEIKELMGIMTWEGVDYLLNSKTSLLV
jgi:hypothetical protein